MRIRVVKMKKRLVILSSFLTILSVLIIIHIIFGAKSFTDMHKIHSVFKYLLDEIKDSVKELYWKNTEYLWTSIILSIEVYIFTFILIRIFLMKSNSNKNIAKKFTKKYKRFLYLFVILTRLFINIVNDLREMHMYVILGSKLSERVVRLDHYYLVASFITGILMSIAIITFYEISQALTWFIFLLLLITFLLYMITLGILNNVGPEVKESLGVYYENGLIIVNQGDIKLTVSEKTILLGSSISFNAIGVITTLGAILMKLSLIFTLIPITSGMISLTISIAEFTGLSSIITILNDLNILSIGLISLLPSISWSIYIGGIIYVLTKYLNLSISQDALLILVAGVWMIIAMLTGSFSKGSKINIKWGIKIAVLFLMPLVLLYI